MKKISINYSGFNNYYINKEDNLILSLLKKHYEVVISDDPDYLFCSLYGDDTYKNRYRTHECPYYVYGMLEQFCDFPRIRILIDGENYVPDFNLVDYAISPYPISYFDRNFYLPCGVEAFFRTDFKNFFALKTGKREFNAQDLQKKTCFANFIASHESENNIRGDFFKKLSQYKRVESAGTYLNNMENHYVVSWLGDSKMEFARKTKFTLCFESTQHDGFITEKIVDAFCANTIPVYFGSRNISDIFNPKAFINCNDYDSFDDAIKDIIRIDNDDSTYLAMMCEPIFVDDDFPQRLLGDLERFLVNIFDQNLEKAYRRSRLLAPLRHEKYLLETHSIMKPIIQRRIDENDKNRYLANKRIEKKKKISGFYARFVPETIKKTYRKLKQAVRETR